MQWVLLNVAVKNGALFGVGTKAIKNEKATHFPNHQSIEVVSSVENKNNQIVYEFRYFSDETSNVCQNCSKELVDNDQSVGETIPSEKPNDTDVIELLKKIVENTTHILIALEDVKKILSTPQHQK